MPDDARRQKTLLAAPESGRWWPTSCRGVTGDGIWLPVDPAAPAWLYMACPLGPIQDARTPQEGLQFGDPIDDALRNIDTWTRVPPGGLARRRLLKHTYRHVHIVLLNVTARFDPAGAGAETLLRGWFPDTLSALHLLMVGVELKPDLAGGRFTDVVSRTARTMLGQLEPGEAWRHDATQIRAGLTRAGLGSLSPKDVALWNGGWWAGGRDPAVHTLPHPSHLHLYKDWAAGVVGWRADQDDQGSRRGGGCNVWTDAAQGARISWATVAQLPGQVTRGADPGAWWGRRLIDAGAVCISIRGLLEPGRVTHKEITSQLGEAEADLDQKEARSGLPADEKRRLVGDIAQIRDVYSPDQDPPPTLIDATIQVGFTGRDSDQDFDPTWIGDRAGVTLNSMEHRQRAAWSETMPCSTTVASPYMHEIPATMAAYAGLGDLSCLGDKPSATAALLGFTERDRQPVWIDHTAPYRSGESQASYGLFTSDQGGGKTAAEQWLCRQWAEGFNTLGEHTPIIVFDPKPDSDQSPVLSACPIFRQVTLSDVIGMDGVCDGLAVATTPTAGVSAAHSYLLSVNPSGGGVDLASFDTPLLNALMFGAKQGIRFSGAAVKAAKAAGLPYAGDILSLLEMQADGSPMFRAFCGMDPDGEPLRAAQGVTYIRVGDSGLDVLGLVGQPMSALKSSQRTQIVLIQALVNAAVYALAGRQGVAMFDEAWTVLSAGKAQMEALNRIIRQLQVSVWLFTQRVSDALRADMPAPAWQVIMSQPTSRAEAAAALQLAGLGATPERLGRITAGSQLPGGAANRESMRPLYSADGRVLRGSVGLTVAPDRQAIYTEIVLPAEVLRGAATNLDALSM